MKQRYCRVKAKRGEAAAFLLAAIEAETDECILWPFSLKPNGYADVKIKGAMRYAHRIVCIAAHGEPEAAELEAAHSCGKRNCINKRHLRWATHIENHADRILHGTSNRGETNGNAILHVLEVKEIKRRLSLGEKAAAIAADFPVSRRTINNIGSGKSWSAAA